jgi:hypothetical protein
MYEHRIPLATHRRIANLSTATREFYLVSTRWYLNVPVTFCTVP